MENKFHFTNSIIIIKREKLPVINIFIGRFITLKNIRDFNWNFFSVHVCDRPKNKGQKAIVLKIEIVFMYIKLN